MMEKLLSVLDITVPEHLIFHLFGEIEYQLYRKRKMTSRFRNVHGAENLLLREDYQTWKDYQSMDQLNADEVARNIATLVQNKYPGSGIVKDVVDDDSVIEHSIFMDVLVGKNVFNVEIVSIKFN